MSQDEIFEIIDEKGNVIAQEKRSIVHEKGLLHRASDIFVLDKKDRIFIQQRSFKKLIGPGLWDMSAAEHLKPGENFEQAAIRGVKEELGVKSTSLKKIGERKQRAKFGNLLDNENVQVFKCYFEGEITLQEKEIEQGKWITKEQLLEETKKDPKKFSRWLIQDLQNFNQLL